MTPHPEAVRALLVAAVPFAYAYATERSTPVASLATPPAKVKTAGEQG